MEESFHGENDKKYQKLVVGQNLGWMYEKFDHLSARGGSQKLKHLCVIMRGQTTHKISTCSYAIYTRHDTTVARTWRDGGVGTF